ncbi:MAG: hypothetical protein BMS9Abin31_0143 [Gammaproteobacteria bacterium]|nr:MAG: hypothetical protein BMS9Abin31_0143 [Gammaproteobacteria bacterium]
MENQHQKIKGYRDLSQEEIDMINNIKETSETLRVMITSLDRTETTDKRWVAMAKSNLQTGIMYAVRSVAQPESF